MKKVINSAIAAFAMFSRIPMPRCDWEKDNIRYMLVFMPLVGAVIGAVSKKSGSSKKKKKGKKR